MGASCLDPAWLAAFDATLVRYFALDHAGAGADTAVLQRYADLPGDQAAMAFAEDYELARLDWWSWGRV
ncbi:hypothetical protein IFT63_11425 [Stenotrophomonas sp. CFBP 13724]|uniref:hypothetical protein n=1 Tax=Stenotrophomonas sp. CFBP 13724 TaxID=2775298 RepID=UPI001780ED06|nr:hypothetical protein [Stenotrophomonas sp. CFBP 13724]